MVDSEVETVEWLWAEFFICTSPEDFKTAFTSYILITGKNLENNKNKVKNKPKELA